MRSTITKTCSILLVCLLSLSCANAQFFNFIPEMKSYIRADVQAELGGLTFNYLWQDSSLGLHNTFIHTDNNGQQIWAKEAGSSFGSYTLAADTSMIVAGVRSVSGGTRVALLHKIDKNGSLVWKKVITSTSNDVGIGNLMTDAAGNIYATVTRSSFSSSTYYSRAGVVKLDAAGTVLWTKYYANPSFTSDYSFSRAMLAANGDFVGVVDIRGSANAQANGMMITRINPAGTILFSKYVNFRDSFTQLSVTGLAETAAGELVFGGRLMTDQISIIPNKMWMAKMDASGNMLMQKIYHGGEDVGELLHSLRYTNGKLYAYMLRYAPSDTVQRSVWIGEVDAQTLSITTHNATKIGFTAEDPYGNVRNSFCISSDGKPTVAAGFYCAEVGKSLPMMIQYSSTLGSSCDSLDRVQPLIDSVSTFPVTTYTPQSSFTIAFAADTSTISLMPTTVTIAGLCGGCANPVPTGIAMQAEKGLLKMYPNPGNGIFQVELATGGELTVYSNMGAVVYKSKAQTGKNPVNISNQAAGVYHIQLRTENGQTSYGRLMKDR